jgi:outer membrane receptor protein involved in Fe transport
VSPTIGANYKITSDFAVYGALGQSVKFPDITAYYNGIPGTTAATPLKPPPVTVKPEHVNDYELGVRYQHGGLSGSLSVYREDFTNTFIDAFNPSTFLTIVSNGGSSRYQGVELQVRNDFGEQPWGDVNAQLSFAYNQAEFTSTFHSDFAGGQGENTDADVLVSAGEPLADVPDVLLSADVNWSYEGWRVDLDGRYVGSQYTDNAVSGTPSTTRIPDYTVIDLNLSKTVPMRSFTGAPGSVKFSLNIDNIGNEYYYNQEYTNSSKDFNGNFYQVASPGAPRSFTGSVLVKF